MAKPRAIRWPSLHQRMQSLGISEEALASSMGVEVRTVQAWTRGERVPHDDGFAPLSTILKCSVEELRADAPIKKFRQRYTNRLHDTQLV
jgi:transcriptional regulator with XRE-family HTH domain